jgi:LL-diaminopimelate aminotransferase
VFSDGRVGGIEGIPAAELQGCRLLWVNYPSNPTAAAADVGFYERVVEFCERAGSGGGGGGVGGGIIAAAALAYSELYLEGPESRPVSLWQARNASIERTQAIEFHSLSKTFNMTGWRIGFAVGHEEVVGALASIKSNVDSGTFNAIQAAGAAALERFDGPEVGRMRALYRERRDAVVPGLRAMGCEVDSPTSGFFVWARTPAEKGGSGGGRPVDSMKFAGRCLEDADVVVVPGGGFSERARSWFRVALTVEAERMREAARRMEGLRW